jgi:hypothetical protein
MLGREIVILEHYRLYVIESWQCASTPKTHKLTYMNLRLHPLEAIRTG